MEKTVVSLHSTLLHVSYIMSTYLKNITISGNVTLSKLLTGRAAWAQLNSIIARKKIIFQFPVGYDYYVCF